MTEISTIIRARLDEGRAIADEDVRALLNENEKLRAEVEGLRATELQRESRQSSGGLSPDDGFGGGKSVFNSSWYGTGR